MLNYRPLSRSRRHIAFVDDSLESAYSRLAVEDREPPIISLPEPSDIPFDERNDEFEAQLAHLKSTDIDYQAALSGTAANARDDEFEILKLDRALRDRLRSDLGMPPRPKPRTSTSSPMLASRASTPVTISLRLPPPARAARARSSP
jgi:hypothetical protein